MSRKILTISIAAYNVEKYLEKALNSLIVDNIEKLEVLIVNDGSKDNTVKIVNSFVMQYPDTFKLIDKKNGGYGSTINEGIKNATGKYFKQLDGDDWYEKDNLNKYLNDLEKLDSDMVYTPYDLFYENNGECKKCPEILNCNVGTYKLDDIINGFPILKMHALTYKTDILKKNQIKITENCFYTDTQYVLFPLLFSKTITIFDYSLYVYRLGLEEQSVSIKGKLKHYKDHVKADGDIISFVEKKLEKLSPNINNYIKNYLAQLFSSCMGNYLMVVKPSREQFEYINCYDKSIMEKNYEVYQLMVKYSKAVGILRHKSYIQYYLLHYAKKLLRRM